MTAEVFRSPPSFEHAPLLLSPPFLSFIPFCQWVPCLTLINSKCKTHLSTAPLPPSSPSWGLGPGLLSSHRLSMLRPLWFVSEI